jgi:ABC-2 type transport system permease protein
LTWLERLAYRVNFFMEILSGVMSSLILVFLWMAVYRCAGREVVGGYSIQEMVTYLLGGGLINSFILTTAENAETSQSIQDGSLSSLLVKPISPYWIWFVRDLSMKSFYLTLGFLGYTVVFFFFREYLTPCISATHLVYLLVSLIFATLLQFFLFEFLSLLAFWVENTYGIRFIMRVVMEVAGGAIIPLSFFQGPLHTIFLALPFPFLIYLPMRIYLGKIPIEAIPWELVKEALWIAGLALLNRVVWKQGIRQYVAMGD